MNFLCEKNKEISSKIVWLSSKICTNGWGEAEGRGSENAGWGVALAWKVEIKMGGKKSIRTMLFTNIYARYAQ